MPLSTFLTKLKISATASLLLLLIGCAGVSHNPDSSDNTENTPYNTPASWLDSDIGAKLSEKLNAKLPTVDARTSGARRVETVDLTEDADDLLARIRNGFAMADINNDLVLYHQQWYQNRPDYLRRTLERGSRYMHFIVEELEKRGMPSELALLPMVESAYNPLAYSSAKAAGLWQFIPSTGKRYKLDQNWWKDERRDVIASTAAALDYLQSIYEMHGDWHLALASYNWGEGAVARAINKNKAQGLPTDYLSLSMPNETKNYVPKLQALKNIISNPSLSTELGLQTIPNRPYFKTITKNEPIDIKLAAKLAGMSEQEFMALNPSHKRPIIESDTPLVIPAHKYDTFVNNLEAHENDNKPLSSWQAYTLRPGEKLEKIAPRFGLSVANLKAINGLKKQSKVGPGLTLLVPGQNSDGAIDMAALAAQTIHTEKDESSTRRAHVVRQGETLAGIAKRYGISAVELTRLNRLKSTKLKAGTRLNLPASNKPAGQKTNSVSKKNQGSSQRSGQIRQVKTSSKSMPKAAAKTPKKQAKPQPKTRPKRS